MKNNSTKIYKPKERYPTSIRDQLDKGRQVEFIREVSNLTMVAWKTHSKVSIACGSMELMIH
jgi:hypothetical protein